MRKVLNIWKLEFWICFEFRYSKFGFDQGLHGLMVGTPLLDLHKSWQLSEALVERRKGIVGIGKSQRFREIMHNLRWQKRGGMLILYIQI
jgi:hypothetical protein